jgi:hypothetical protein
MLRQKSDTPTKGGKKQFSLDRGVNYENGDYF